MKNLIAKSALGVAMGVAMLSGCGPNPIVSGQATYQASKTSKLSLDKGSVAYPGFDNNDTRVYNSRLTGIYVGCQGHPQPDAYTYEAWEMYFEAGNPNVKVSQNDASCSLRASGIIRELDNGDVEYFFFHQVTIQNDAISVGPKWDIPIRDGYLLDNLSMAVREDDGNGNSDVNDGALSALVNISGVNTGTDSGGGFTQDFEVNLLTGTTAAELRPEISNSQIVYSRNIQTSSRELPAPTYVLNSRSVHVFVNPVGIITPSSYGSYKFTVVASDTGVSQYGTEFVVSMPGDGDPCVDVQCTVLHSVNELTTLPLGPNWTELGDAEKYQTLFNRWQMLKKLGRPVKTIGTSDRSISLPILTVFPLQTQMFLAPRTGAPYYETEFTESHNHAVILIRYKANGAAGDDFDAASGVISYQAFELDINAPSLSDLTSG